MKRLSTLGAVGAVGIASLAFQTADAETLSGTMRNNANTCPWAILNINLDDCTYNNSNAFLQTTYYNNPDPWVGPGMSSAFYASSIGVNPPSPGDGKVSPTVTANISVGAGNVVSGTITIENVSVHNFSAGASTGRGEESWLTRTLTLAPKAADIIDGSTLIIGSAGFPAYLQPDPALPGLYGDEFTSEQGADSNGSSVDVLYWAAPSGIGIATWETAGGATTSIGTTATQASTGYGCNNTPNAGGDPCGSASALENRGEFENVLLKVFTDGAGRVTGAEGILVQEAVQVAGGGRKSWVAWRFSVSAPADAVDDAFTVVQDTPNNILDVGANDINFDDPTTAAIGAQPDQGGTALVQNSPGDPTGIAVSYTPATGFAGTETFTYTMNDSVNPVDSAMVTVTVVALGANDDVASTGVGDPVTIAVGANDNGFSDPTTAAITMPPSSGNAVPANSPGDPQLITVIYTPNPGYAGTDTFEYSMTDAVGSDTATVTVTVADLVPVAPDTTVTTSEGTPVNVIVDDISGVEFGNPPSNVSISTPANGRATIALNGSAKWVVTYSPDQFFSGMDTIDYTIEDADSESATGTITVTVSGSMPIANADVITLAPIAVQAIDVRQNDIPGSGPLVRHTVSITQAPSHGTATVDADQQVVYTPDEGFNGAQDSLQYTLEDETGDVSAPARVDITVTPFSNKEQIPAPSVSATGPVGILSLIGLGWILRWRRRSQ